MGWWAVAETGQGGALPDALHGPYWDEDEARTAADEMTADARGRGRSDTFTVVGLVPHGAQDGVA